MKRHAAFLVTRWLMLASALTILYCGETQAATFDVACNPDSDIRVNDLIGAINSANGNGEDDTINLAADCIYFLEQADNSIEGANGLPSITTKITINGNGATIEGDRDYCRVDYVIDYGEFRIFHVASTGVLELSHLTVRNGCADDGTWSGASGGGIFNRGVVIATYCSFIRHSAASGGAIISVKDPDSNAEVRVTLDHSTLSGNSAPFGEGGAIWNISGELTLTDSIVSDNSAWVGGGIYNRAGMTMNRSILADNSAMDSGGGIFNSGTARITDSSVFGNSAEYEGGGLIAGGTVTIAGSTFSGNSANIVGGGISNYGNLSMTNSTISGNFAGAGGGGIFNSEGLVTLAHITLTNNSAKFGAGISNGETISIKNSIVANSTNGLDCNAGRGATWNIEGTNFTTDGSCAGFTQKTAAQLNLGALADNGGPTKTHALLIGSHALNAALDCTLLEGTDTLPQDQRGMARPQGSACDVGAFEATILTVNGMGTGSGTVKTASAINCVFPRSSGACSEPIGNFTAPLALAVFPSPGSIFSGWSGDPDCTDGIVTLDHSLSCTAMFSLDLSPCLQVITQSGSASMQFKPRATRAASKNVKLTVFNNTGTPLTVSALTLILAKLPASIYRIVGVRPALPTTIQTSKKQKFTVTLEKAAGTPAETVNAPFFNIGLSCGVLASSENPSLASEAGKQGQWVQGSIYDLKGRLLFSARQAPAAARDLEQRFGKILGNGVYLYLATSRDHNGRINGVELRKLVILR